MKPVLAALRIVAIFAAAMIIGYLVLVFGWIAYASLFDIPDRDGGKGMEIVFIVAPVAAAVVGLVAAILLSHLTPRRAG